MGVRVNVRLVWRRRRWGEWVLTLALNRLRAIAGESSVACTGGCGANHRRWHRRLWGTFGGFNRLNGENVVARVGQVRVGFAEYVGGNFWKEGLRCLDLGL